MDVIYQAKRDDSARSGPHSPVQKTPIARYTPPISPLRREERDEADADAKSIRSGAQPSFFRRLLCCRSSRAVSTDPGTLDEIELGGPSYVSDPNALLPPLLPEDTGKKCLVLDLDETLVHSSFKPVPNADFVIPVEINGIVHQVHVLKRPGVDRFLKFCAKYFEVVVFTASLSKYADPLLDLLDPNGVFRARLFREACDVHDGLLVKDLARLGRDMGSVIIIDNSPVSYMLQPENALPIASFFDDPNDRELDALLPYLKRLVHVENVYRFLEKINIDRGESTEYDPSTY